MIVRTAVLGILALVAAGPGAAAEPDSAAVLERYQGSVVPIRYTQRPREAPAGGEGQKVERVVCGVIVGDDGLIAISGDPFPQPGQDPRTTLDPVEFVMLGAGEVEYAAEAIGLNRDLNLAYLRLDGKVPGGYQAVRFDPDVPIRIGQPILVLGLLPERYDYARTFWTGRVSAAIEEPRSMYAVTTFVQDLSIGGLAVTQDGIPLGLIAEDVLPPASRSRELPANPLAIFGSLSQGPRVGYPMIFPVALFADDLSSPPELEREPARAWFGITMQPLSRSLGDYWKIDNPGGVIVSSVLEGSPAEAAGIQPGDVLLQVGDEVITTREAPGLIRFRQMVEKLPAGEEAPLSVWRDGAEVDLVIRPSRAPRTGFLALDHEDVNFGLTVRELTPDVIQGRGLSSDTQGVVIAELEPAGWAMVSGLHVGDIILRVDETIVSDLDAFRGILDQLREARAPETYFFVQRGVETLFVRVRTDW